MRMTPRILWLLTSMMMAMMMMSVDGCALAHVLHFYEQNIRLRRSVAVISFFLTHCPSRHCTACICSTRYHKYIFKPRQRHPSCLSSFASKFMPFDILINCIFSVSLCDSPLAKITNESSEWWVTHRCGHAFILVIWIIIIILLTLSCDTRTRMYDVCAACAQKSIAPRSCQPIYWWSTNAIERRLQMSFLNRFRCCSYCCCCRLWSSLGCSCYGLWTRTLHHTSQSRKLWFCLCCVRATAYLVNTHTF